MASSPRRQEEFTSVSGRVFAVLGIVAVALSLRTAVASLSPLVEFISADLPSITGWLGVIGMLPPVVFAVVGLAAPYLFRRVSLETGMVLVVLLLAIGSLLRAQSGSVAALLTASVVAFAGTGLGNVLLPPIVKRYFPSRIGALTAVYAMLISVSTALPALIAVPLAEALDWRWAMAVWAIVAIPAIIPWAVLILGSRRRKRRQAGADAADPAPIAAPPQGTFGLWRSPVAWAIVILLTVSATNAYSVFAWLPILLRDLTAMSALEAGNMLGLYAAIGLPVALIGPMLASRRKGLTGTILLAVGVLSCGNLGLLLAPETLTGLWVVLTGIGGIIFPLSLALIGLRSRSTEGAAALSGFSQGLSYVLAALATLCFGLLHDLFGSWDASLWFLILVSLSSLAAVLLLQRARYVEDSSPAMAAQTRRTA